VSSEADRWLLSSRIARGTLRYRTGQVVMSREVV
jgi:hypothetical protein